MSNPHVAGLGSITLWWHCPSQFLSIALINQQKIPISDDKYENDLGMRKEKIGSLDDSIALSEHS